MKTYLVFNRSDKSRVILAKSGADALAIARRIGHLESDDSRPRIYVGQIQGPGAKEALASQKSGVIVRGLKMELIEVEP